MLRPGSVGTPILHGAVDIQSDLVAALDMGSNSFRLQVSRIDQGQLITIDSLKESVRLAAGLQPDGTLTDAVVHRALLCLQRFGERLRGVDPKNIRVVGTNTLRVAQGIENFLHQAEKFLGVPVQVISGQEEARLIYQGVSRTLPPAHGNRLVIDIGGGSTELILGHHQAPVLLESIYMGCVSYSQRFFEGGRVTELRLKEAVLAASSEIQGFAESYQQLGWVQAIGSSGTARALSDLLSHNHLTRVGEITFEGLVHLKQALLKAGSASRLEWPGMKADRIPVLAGGFAIMWALFKALKIESMTTTESGLREGVLFEMIGRMHHHDIRYETVAALMSRYAVNMKQAKRVREWALNIFKQLVSPAFYDQYSQHIGWAADLHEIGLSIAHGGYHRHSAYIIENADMPGFTLSEQYILSGLLLGQKGRLDKVFDRVHQTEGWSMLLSLRLALLLCRSRVDCQVPVLQVSVKGRVFVLIFDSGWLQENPLVLSDLNSERRQWGQIGRFIKIKTITS